MRQASLISCTFPLYIDGLSVSNALVAPSHKDDKYAEIVTDRAQGLVVYSISNSLSNGFSGWDYA
ncbi:hypothetical protein [Streptococcus ruminantium]|uniref:hypothetical protein n=1 Tax=Streptococcus ruminantium TaxID=1917441 RepID=UPI001883B40B|nr:hypothetical protein [Streptococcus ruminantium]